MSWTTRPASEVAGNIAAQIKGKGPALVLVHGVGLCAQAWEAAGDHLAQHMEVHALDMPGHGRSPLDGAASLGAFSDRIGRYVESLGQPVRIAGHSMGAMIALQLAARASLNLTHVAALNAIFRRTRKAADAVQARAAALSSDRVSDPEPTLTRWFGPHPQGALASASAACRDWLTQANPSGYKAAYTIFAQHDGPEDKSLHEMACPAMFLTGARDPNSTPEMSRAMGDLCPNGEVVVVKEAAHMLPLTHPRETAQHLETFFMRTGAR